MNNLKELRINQEGILPSFNKDIYDYYLTINEDVDNLQIEAIPENPDSKIEIVGNNNFIEGENTIVIKVINDNEETNYNINVVKTENIEMSNCNLEIFAIENYLFEPAFDTNITEYKLEVPNDITNLNIFAVPEVESAKIEINGSNNLNVGDNLIEIIVTAQDKKTKKIYTIFVYRKTKKETNDYEEIKKINDEKVQELLNENDLDYEYNTEKTNLELTQYKSNSKVIEMGILISIIIILLIIVILLISKKSKKNE